eukprot:TRINITY_DN78446_c0_g1_i1.p1 TRINITY_DN78446_c0_g1~~TRINITY_DN78446_c0_g1_i1.p1  ORF type:complete len:857 (-),score=158.62 TRINITY_DN78446_c0_g1_i1:114-2309(-)
MDPTKEAVNKFVPTSGVLTFLPSEHMKSFQVKILQDESWSAVTHFHCVLSDPENCYLSDMQRRCRVTIIDDDFFPHNKHREAFESGNGNAESGASLLWSYLLFNLEIQGVAWRVILMLFLDQLHNAYFLLTTYMNIYMVDVLFKHVAEGLEDDEAHSGEESGEELQLFGGVLFEGSRQRTAVLCAWLYILPLFVLHLADIIKVRLNVSGRSREFLQLSLFRKYLNFSWAEQAHTAPVNIGVGVITECAEISEMGFMKAVSMLRLFCKMLIVGNFVHMEQPNAVLPMVGVAFLTMVWVFMRIPALTEHAVMIIENEKGLMETVLQTAEKYRLVADYHKRPFIGSIFFQRAKKLTDAKNTEELGLLNSRYFFTWAATIAAGVYIMTATDEVLSGAISLGTYLAMLKIIFELGSEFQEVFDEVVELMRTIGPLRAMIRYFNAEMNLQCKCRESIARQQEMRRQIAVLHDAGKVDFDLIPICLRDLKFQYEPEHDAAARSRGTPFRLQCPGKLIVPQGQMVAVIGAHSAGKTTLLSMIGSVYDVPPESGSIFIPPHLRVLNVMQQPILHNGSLVQNLAYGLPGEGDPSCHDRLRRIAKALEFDSGLTALMEADFQGKCPHNWHVRVSQGQIALIHVARAFIANPNVIISHRPSAMFNKDRSIKVISLLRQFVSNRGVCVDGASSARRPRTCFYSSDRMKDHGFADQIWEVNKGRLKCVRPEAAPELPALTTKYKA